MAEPTKAPRTLGPNQLAWLRSNVEAFRIAEEAVAKVRDDVEANKREMAA